MRKQIESKYFEPNTRNTMLSTVPFLMSKFLTCKKIYHDYKYNIREKI